MYNKFDSKTYSAWDIASPCPAAPSNSSVQEHELQYFFIIMKPHNTSMFVFVVYAVLFVTVGAWLPSIPRWVRHGSHPSITSKADLMHGTYILRFFDISYFMK
jgi:hypothetical protein